MALAPPCAEQSPPRNSPPQDKEPIGTAIWWMLRGPQRGLGDTGREGLLANVALGKRGGGLPPQDPPSDPWRPK